MKFYITLFGLIIFITSPLPITEHLQAVKLLSCKLRIINYFLFSYSVWVSLW